MRLRNFIPNYALLLFLAISLFACQNDLPTKSNSLLADALCQPEDFPGKWHWRIGDVNKNQESSLVGNNFAFESIARAFGGYRKDGSSVVTIWHRIERYTQPVTEFRIQKYDKFDEEGQIWAPTLPKLGHSMFSSCSKSSGIRDTTYYCKVVVNYTHIISNLTFIETGLNDSEIEQMLESVLMQIDERIREISQ